MNDKHLEVRTHAARKSHGACSQCGKRIKPGQMYFRVTAWDYDQDGIVVYKIHHPDNGCASVKK